MPIKSGRILVIDDDDDVLLAARLFLKRHVAQVHTERTPEKIPSRLQNGRYDVILLDMNFTRDAGSGREGFHWLNRILDLDPAAAVVLITAYGDVDMAVRAIKAGATDFVLKPWQNEKLLATVSAAMALSRSRQEIAALRSRARQLGADIDHPFQEFIGDARAMRQVRATIRKVAPTDANVLILGENGTGKELVARAIHRQSPRRDEAFVGVDMGAISESLFESELFGHVRGAFTDARQDRAGRFEIASGGTLFLDEIGNLSRTSQAKILTALQNRQITRLGSNTPIPIDVRLICATNMPIYDMVADRTFRPDLLYRIKTVEILLPPLRDRIEDLPALAEHFVAVYARKYRTGRKRIAAAAVKKLASHPWPGNIRELQHAIERAVIMSEGRTLAPSDFFFAVPDGTTGTEIPVFDEYNLDEVDKAVIRKALARRHGNVSRAARDLGLTRASLYRRMEKYGL